MGALSLRRMSLLEVHVLSSHGNTNKIRANGLIVIPKLLHSTNRTSRSSSKRRRKGISLQPNEEILITKLNLIRINITVRET